MEEWNIDGGVFDKAIHFVIRHWHKAADPKGYESEDGSYTVIIAGYIVPLANGGDTADGDTKDMLPENHVCIENKCEVIEEGDIVSYANS